MNVLHRWMGSLRCTFAIVSNQLLPTCCQRIATLAFRYINMFGCERFASGIYYVKSKFKTSEGGDVAGAFDGDPFFSSWQEVRQAPTHSLLSGDAKRRVNFRWL